MSSDPISPEAARKIVLAEAAPLEAEPVALEGCLGRVTAREVRSPIDLQPFDNSAMDGYALRSGDTHGPRPRLRLVGESRAAHPAAADVGPGEAIWISTGAMVPEGADSVLPLEDASEDDGHLVPGRRVREGENVRRAGEDVRAGEALLPAGAWIGAAELAVLAAAGAAEVPCVRRPRVAVFSSGDELVDPGQPLGPGQIHDSNALALAALVSEAGGEPVRRDRLPDRPRPVYEALSAALDRDVLVIAGGVSVGRHDHVKRALAAAGVAERFWRVAMRPGGPTWFGVLSSGPGSRSTLVFGLPGNPVSAMVTFHLFVRPALRAMLGLDPQPRRVRAALATSYRKKPGKAHFLRCRLEPTPGGWRAHLTRESQGSHVLTSMLAADALCAIPADCREIAAGAQVEAERIRSRP